MTLINANKLSVTLGAPLFSNLDLTLGKGDRIGLVAANGRGKSTLLRVLAGTDDATHGDVTFARGLRPGLVQQDVPEPLLDVSLYDAVLSALDKEAAETESWRVDIVLDDLAVPAELRDRPLRALSGGWQRITLLARVWVTEPDVLLMDEPTNHLDLSRIGFLQTWMDTVARGTACIIASHDRAFLDAATTRTLFLRAEGSQSFAVPYSDARVALEVADAAEAKRFDNEMAKADQLRRQAAKLKNIGINSGSDLLVNKTKQLKERAEKIEEAARPAFAEKSAGAIRLVNSGTHAKALLSLDDITVTAPDGRALFQSGQIWVNRGDRVVILGANGAGKTQFLNAIIAALSDDVPGIRVAPTATPGVSDQGLTQIDGYKTPMDAVTTNFAGGDQRARGMLANAGMDIRLQTSPISALSGGQRARLAMLLLRLANPNFYLLDEPTNHLDIEGQETLEAELCAHGATAILISHDRTFIRNTGTRFWQISGKKLIEVDDPEPFIASQL